MKNHIVLVGAGGFGREILWLLEEVNSLKSEWDILGFVDDSDEMQSKIINGYPVLGTCQWLIEYPKSIAALCCIGDPHVRMQVVERLLINTNIFFPNLIGRDVQYSRSVKFGQGCIIFPSSVLTVNVRIGNFVIINLDCTVGHDAVLEDFVILYPSVNVTGNIHIGALTGIGTGTNIIPGRKIGCNTTVAVGSVVVKDIPNNCVAAGCPARVVKRLDGN